MRNGFPLPRHCPKAAVRASEKSANMEKRIRRFRSFLAPPSAVLNNLLAFDSPPPFSSPPPSPAFFTLIIIRNLFSVKTFVLGEGFFDLILFPSTLVSRIHRFELVKISRKTEFFHLANYFHPPECKAKRGSNKWSRCIAATVPITSAVNRCRGRYQDDVRAIYRPRGAWVCVPRNYTLAKFCDSTRAISDPPDDPIRGANTTPPLSS